jgi:hypothetical protein
MLVTLPELSPFRDLALYSFFFIILPWLGIKSIDEVCLILGVTLGPSKTLHRLLRLLHYQLASMTSSLSASLSQKINQDSTWLGFSHHRQRPLLI